MKHLLFYPCNSDLRLQEYLILASILKENFKITFLLFLNSSDVQRDVKRINDAGHECRIISSTPEMGHSPFFSNLFIRRYFPFLVSKSTSIGQWLYEKDFTRRYKAVFSALITPIKELHPDIIIMTRDNGWSPVETGLLKAAELFSIKVVLPFLMYHAEEGTHLLLQGNTKYHNSPNANFYQRYIFNRFKHLEYKEYHYYPAFLLQTLHSINVLSDFPWRFGFNRLVTKTIVPNTMIYDEYRSRNLSETRLEILPDLSYIPLFTAYKNKIALKGELIEKYRLHPQKLLMFISLPDLAHHGYITSKEEHIHLHTLADALCKFDDRYSKLIVLKPAMKKSDYLFLETEYGFTIIDEKTMYALPAADIYITMYSSTILWSLLCGIKTVVLNYFIKLPTYFNLPSIAWINNEQEIYSVISNTLVSSSDFSVDWKMLSREETFTEGGERRYIEFFQKLTDD